LWLGNEECEVTWESEDVIPKCVLQEFEDDTLIEVQKLSTEKIGQTSHTLSVKSSKHESEARPVQKKTKTERVIVNSNDGYVHTE